MELRGDIARRLGALVGAEHVAGDGVVSPGAAEEVAAVLALANEEHLRVAPAGNFSQQTREEAQARADVVLCLRRLNRLKQYEPADLTASMEAGITVAELAAALAPHRQWLPLGVARPECATMGGALATNASGPFRLFYGAARDMVIGVRFATVEGKLVKSGGMVVKNVAGYDMAKLIIGSHGTLAVITDVNVKVFPRPETETAVLGFRSLEDALKFRGALLASVLAPLALDLFDAAAAALIAPQEFPQAEFLAAVAYGGVEAVIERTRRELAALAQSAGATASTPLAGEDERRVWKAVCDLPATLAVTEPGGARIRLSSTLTAMKPLLDAAGAEARARGVQAALVARAGSGISYVYARGGDLAAFCRQLRQQALSLEAHAVIEFAPPAITAQLGAWGPRRDNYPVMQKLKQAFDPNAILNPGRFLC